MNIEQQYWEAVQSKICIKCVDSDGMGNCRLTPVFECALKQHFPLIVTAVNNVHSENIEDYNAELRTIVCTQCKHQSSEGLCQLRNSIDCGLDRYFPLVIEAIEEVNRRASV
ncbi:MAG: hypothetical protein FJ218_04480 [Ignavibacteria bacterium]|nr:hypothetical protein [Ignavibacteria bacterium]